jgi:hypothetical protein
MSNPTFYINRQTETARGTGLPCMKSKRYQQRFLEITTTDPKGYWQVPNNKLPTFQVWSDFELTGISIVAVENSIDGEVMVIPVSNMEKICTTNGVKIYSMLDVVRDFVLDCGLYYFILEFDNGTSPYIYSELFLVGGVCAYCCIGLNYTQIQLNMDNSVDFSFSVGSGNALVTSYANTVGGTPNTMQSFTGNIPVGNTDVTISFSTTYCGTYRQNYTFSNLAGVVTVSKKPV